jgi:hypothetical protein
MPERGCDCRLLPAGGADAYRIVAPFAEPSAQLLRSGGVSVDPGRQSKGSSSRSVTMVPSLNHVGLEVVRMKLADALLANDRKAA